jgi:hypothetical protein
MTSDEWHQVLFPQKSCKEKKIQINIFYSIYENGTSVSALYKKHLQKAEQLKNVFHYHMLQWTM